MSELTISQLNKLGNRIRNNDNPTNEDLELLYYYRMSFQNELFIAFKTMCKLAKNVNQNIIVTNRLKTYESIIRKTKRFNTRLSKMQDIAGCRCVVPNNKILFRLRTKIKESGKYEIIEEYDYLDGKEDGYKSYHMIIKNSSTNKIVEIQLRTEEHHKWATLVELTDVVFYTDIKGGESNTDYNRLFKLLSLGDKLTHEEIREISDILIATNFIYDLNNRLSKDNISKRLEWYNQMIPEKNCYLLVEMIRTNGITIKSFEDFSDAENEYLNRFKLSRENKLFLTYTQNTSFEKFEMSYPNYTISYHNFQIDSLNYLLLAIKKCINSNDFYHLPEYTECLLKIFKNILSNLENELITIVKYSETNSIEAAQLVRQSEQWSKIISNRISRLRQISIELNDLLNPNDKYKYYKIKFYRYKYSVKNKIREFFRFGKL